jgi:hypothetical protein
MSVLSFRHRAIAHLRDHLDAHTEMLPQARIEDERGNARFQASLIGARTSSTLNLASLYTFTAAAVAAFIGQRPMSAAAHTAASYGAITLAVLATGFLAAAMWTRRQAKIPLAIEIRGDAMVDVDALEKMREANGKRATWVFAEHGFTKEARAVAARLDMRLFAPHGQSIVECLPVAGHAEERAA